MAHLFLVIKNTFIFVGLIRFLVLLRMMLTVAMTVVMGMGMFLMRMILLMIITAKIGVVN
jgi:hypothetical protein